MSPEKTQQQRRADTSTLRIPQLPSISKSPSIDSSAFTQLKRRRHNNYVEPFCRVLPSSDERNSRSFVEALNLSSRCPYLSAFCTGRHRPSGSRSSGERVRPDSSPVANTNQVARVERFWTLCFSAASLTSRPAIENEHRTFPRLPASFLLAVLCPSFFHIRQHVSNGSRDRASGPTPSTRLSSSTLYGSYVCQLLQRSDSVRKELGIWPWISLLL